MSELKSFHAIVSKFPADVKFLISMIQGILIHSDWLSEYGVETKEAPLRTTLPTAEKLRQVLALDMSALQRPRPPAKRAHATCRDFALMLCSLLRSKSIPARVRCGFAAYFGNAWEDHWVCEYLKPGTDRWELADAQIDEFFKRRYQIIFHPADLPRDQFLTAGEAWAKCRAGVLDPENCGHGTATGLWFLAVNVVRDHYALNNMETSAWDTWRGASAKHKSLKVIDLSSIDELARWPEQPLRAMEPLWLRSD